MLVRQAEYVASYPSIKDCPPPDLPEYAFIGRSNVGKSSLINMLCNRIKLAHTSNRPGKTQMINYFLINENWYLVDLPGYGYAQISKKMRQRWKVMIEGYLRNRENLQCAFLLIDSCVPPQKVDLEFANWMGENQVPFVIAFTKTDRKKAKEDNIEAFKEEFLKSWEEMPQYFVTSAQNKTGQEDILGFIGGINQLF